jgi:galactofuranose transport system ATP-binding protein
LKPVLRRVRPIRFTQHLYRRFVDEHIELLDIKTASSKTPIKSLSGGNQQKVILARWLLTKPQFMILDEPTRGIDIGTKSVSRPRASSIRARS